MEYYGLQRMRVLYLLIRQYHDERMYNMTMGQACLKQVVNENQKLQDDHDATIYTCKKNLMNKSIMGNSP